MKKSRNILCILFVNFTIVYFFFAPHGYAVTPLPENAAAAWLLDDGEGDIVKDSGKNEIHGKIYGAVWVKGAHDEALEFDGVEDYVTIPDSPYLNTGGPYTDRTILAVFKVNDASSTIQKQTIYEEGGRIAGCNIYVYDEKVYVGAWSHTENIWDGEWLSSNIESGKWYCVALVIRNGTDKIRKGVVEMWLDGKLTDKRPGRQVDNHPEDIGIGAVVQNTVFNDNGGDGTRHHNLRGRISEIRVYNEALSKKDLSLGAVLLSGKPNRDNIR